MEPSVRLGIIGLGNMGAQHGQQVVAGKIPRLTLAAVADSNPALLARFPGVNAFPDAASLISSGSVDAVLIATPHYAHTDIGVAALKAGLHVLVEKPVSVHKADAERLLAAHTNPRQVFAAMFNQRTDRYYQKIRELIQEGELGALKRVSWIITTWFRTQAYYNSGGWRATWAGEGGGVLLNQCPHNLDLFWWFFGQPSRLRAYCHFGKHHRIEVEDEVTAYCEFPNGATGVFITSTGEAPGTNRLEITGDRGRLVYENDRLRFFRTAVPVSDFSATSQAAFGAPEVREMEISADGHGGQHGEILQNFTAAILDQTPLLAPAHEGMHSVELANAMLLSTWQNRTIELPISGTEYALALQEKIAAASQRPASGPARPGNTT